MCDVGRAGAAFRRRQRQLRAFHRHEAMSVKLALATALHHSAQRVEVPREVEEYATHVGPRAQKTPPPGMRPASLAEPQGAQERVQQRTMELSTSCRWSLCSMLLCRRWWTSWRMCSSSSTSSSPRRRSKCPGSQALPVLLLVEFFLCCRRRNSWWMCHCRPLDGCRHGSSMPMTRRGHASGTLRDESTGGAWTQATSSGTPRRGSPPAQGGTQILGKNEDLPLPCLWQSLVRVGLA